MRKVSLLLTILVLNISAFSQAIGEWTTHTPGRKVISVDLMNDNVYAATPYDIFYYNTIDNSINHLSKTNGLSDIGISIIKHHKNYDVMFVGYSNTNIDLIDNQGNIINIPDIYNKYILGTKTINDVYFKGRYAYVCCSFGIVVIDLKRYEVYDTYIIGNNGSYLCVNDLTENNGVFYAATDNGVYYADVDNTHLADFSQWKQFRHDLPYTNEIFSHVETFDGYVIAVHSDKLTNNDNLYTINDTTSWGIYLDWSQHLVSDLRAYDDFIVMTGRNYATKVFDKYGNRLLMTDDIGTNSSVYDAINDCYWIGTENNSLAKVYPTKTTEFIPFDGPYSDKIFNIHASGNDIWAASGGYREDWSLMWTSDGFYHYDGSWWSNINETNIPELVDFLDITCVKPSPINKDIVYASSCHQGLAVFKNNQLQAIYDHNNSGLGEHTILHNTYVTGFDFDSNNNMWIANNGAEFNLVEWKTNGTWQKYNIGNQFIGRIMVDKNDLKWVFKRNGEILVFNGNKTKTVNDGATTGNLPGTANCFAKDNKGTVWVGTTDGVGLFYDSKRIFNNTFSCSKILIPRNDGSGQADYLLSGQSVLAIAADGANDMWFGTTNGAIHITNDGQKILHHFTTDNSPLPSNTVKDIAITDDGFIFFSTENGLVSYRGTTTKGNENNNSIVVYPNPVRPEHNGTIGIIGLVTNALVKITTTDGAFVTHIKAKGGQAIWDRTDINGNIVQPGIYLIFVSDEKGKETYATKVLIMK